MGSLWMILWLTLCQGQAR